MEISNSSLSAHTRSRLERPAWGNRIYFFERFDVPPCLANIVPKRSVIRVFFGFIRKSVFMSWKFEVFHPKWKIERLNYAFFFIEGPQASFAIHFFEAGFRKTNVGGENPADFLMFVSEKGPPALNVTL